MQDKLTKEATTFNRSPGPFRSSAKGPILAVFAVALLTTNNRG
jgi:hypothetical protein